MRLHQLESLGFFLDEAAHTDWARLVWRLQPFHAASDGKWLNVLWISAFWPFNAGVWVSRASGLFVTTCGFACLLAAGQSFSFRTVIIAAVLYIFLPLSFFFERMALADPLSAAFVAGAIWTALRAYRHSTNNLQWAVFCGVALAAAILSKLTNLVFLCIPFLAAITLIPFKQWRQSLRVAATTYLTIGLAIIVPIVLLKYIGHSDFGFDLVITRSGATAEFQLIPLILSFASTLQAYLPFPLWLFIGIGIVAALWYGKRQTYFLGNVLIVTLTALLWQSASTGIEPRYLLVYAPLAVLLAAFGLARLLEHRQMWMTVGLVIVMAVPGFLFAGTAWVQPEELALPAGDRWQYISGWPSGYGFNQIADVAAQQTAPLTLVTLDLGGQQRLNGYLLGRSTVVTSLIYKPGMDMTDVWLLLDRPKDDGDIEQFDLNLTELARYPRPGNESAVIVYRAEP